MARKLEVEIIASTLGYTKGLVKAGEQTKLFARTVDESSKHIGRSLAFATGGFVAFSGATEFLKASIDAARDAGVSQRQLAAQMKASGDSFQQSQGRIEKAGLALEKFGFTSEDSAKALTVLERGTGNITKAISLQGTAANLARAKNIDLASAANVLAKVFGGQETALRRAVPGLDKHAHGLDLITEAQKRLAGQAAAATTPAERFQATLHDTEVIIGTALLPTINKYLGELGDWLEKMNRSGRLQRDVNGAVKTATGLFHDLKAIVDPLVGAFKLLSGAVGGTKNALELLAGVLLTMKTAKYLSGIGLIGKTADTSAGKVTGLRGKLVGLGGVTVPEITIPVIVAETILQSTPYKKSKSWIDRNLGPAGVLFSGPQDIYHAIATAVGNIAKGPFASGTTRTGLAGPLGTPRRTGLAGAIGSPSISVPGTVAGRTIGNYTPEQILQMRLAGDPNNTSLLQQQAAYDRRQIAFLQRLKTQGRGPGATQSAAEITAFKSDLTSTLGTIAGIADAAAQAIKDAAAKTAAARKRAAAAAARALAKGQRDAAAIGQVYLQTVPKGFLGLDYSGQRAAAAAGHAYLMGVDQSQIGIHSLAQLQQKHYQSPAGLQVDLAREQANGKSMVATLRAVRAAARKALKSGILNWQAQIDAYNAIIDANDQLKNSAKHAKDTFRQQRHRAVALAAAQGAGYQYATALPGPTIHIEHFHSNASNPKQLEEQLTHRAKARAVVRRGAR